MAAPRPKYFRREAGAVPRREEPGNVAVAEGPKFGREAPCGDERVTAIERRIAGEPIVIPQQDPRDGFRRDVAGRAQRDRRRERAFDPAGGIDNLAARGK